jgi:Tle cognate immunity protein 4 C-terminal domain/Tle cognate immunity protein 4 N-terminal domain
MTRIRKRGWPELIVLLAALACAGSWAASQVRSMRDRSEVAQMTEKMKTVCVGRYLIDVPDRSEISLSHERIHGFAIETVEESESEFRQRIAEREADIEAHGADAKAGGEGGMVEARDLRVPGMAGRTFIFGRSRGYLMEGGRRVNLESVSVETHGHMGGLSFSLSATSTGEDSARAAEALLAQLRLRGEDEIPSTPGFCIWRAVFVEPLPTHQSEQVAMHLSMPDHPDLVLSLLSVAGGNPGPGLLARSALVDAKASADEMLRVTKLRSEQRSINSLDGEEVVERIREFNFTTTYTLGWETRGAAGNVLLPFLSLQAQAGISVRPSSPPVGASLHEDAVLTLWDSIASSLRLRKDGPPPQSGSPSAPQGPELGAMAKAGEVCPQSGWWRCAEEGRGVDVHGGQVQYMRKGERMPQALLLPRQTLWQRVKRVQPSVESRTPTTWTLVDKRQHPRRAAAVSLAPAVSPASETQFASDGPPAVVPGTHVRTGDACPASGWWRCEEQNALDGTRWFERGARMPAATFQVPTGRFGKSAGPEVIQRRSGWQLMRHCASPSGEAAGPSLPEGLSAGEPLAPG